MPRSKADIAKAKRRTKAAERAAASVEWRAKAIAADKALKKAEAKKIGASRLEPPPIPSANPIKFALTPKQEEAMDLLIGDQRHTMLVGGSRSGKTFLLVRAVVTRALRGDGSRHVIFRLRGNACRQSIWMDTFAKVIRLCFPGTKVQPHLMDGYVTLPNGSEIWFAGLDDKDRVEKILGMEFVTIYFCECSQIPYASVEVALTRLAQKIEGLKARAYYDLNPTTKKHWTAQLFLKGINPSTRRPVVDPHNYKWMKINPVDNVDNIDKDYIESLQAMSSRAKKRFFDGEYLDEIDGALWTPEILERTRVDGLVGDLQRVIIAVDPSGAKGEEDKRSDHIGITVAGKIEDHAFIIKDETMKGRPEEWGKRVVDLFRAWNADCIVAEKNFGGDMVRSTIHAVDPYVKVKLVTASRGKVVRAEPVSALFERGIVHMVGDAMTELEEELCCFTADKYVGDRSPNRADAMVWAVTELLFGSATVGMLDFYRDWNAALEAQQAVDNATEMDIRDAIERAKHSVAPTGMGIVMPAQSFDPIEYLKQLAALRPPKPERDKTRAW